MPLGFVESLLWLSLNVYHESRGEPEIGQLAVAHVTLNRALEENKSLADVIMAPNQFSWTFQKKSYVPLEINPLQDSLCVALKAMATPDFTSGSTFYHHVDVDPKWAAGKRYTGQYGSHKFYRDGTPSISASAHWPDISYLILPEKQLFFTDSPYLPKTGNGRDALLRKTVLITCNK